ncbi:MAG: phospholipase D-like domain-containing protein, partial [Candidatus Omnitrophica bacterium]|nr:phospholipase D-like domain-containing protein [Candidatus Omnitrophota bacterium]
MRRKLIVLFNALDKAVSKVQLLVICILAVLLTICLSVFNESGQVYFSPNGGCQEAIVSEISKARKNIDIAVYYLTSREIAQELVTAKDRGVKAR